MLTYLWPARRRQDHECDHAMREILLMTQDEWEQVVQAHGVATREEYLRVSRVALVPAAHRRRRTR